MSDGHRDRKHLTFEQAEGVEPLPSQLKLKEVSQELRARLWAVFLASMRANTYNPTFSPTGEVVAGQWLSILHDKHISRDHKMADEFDNHADYQIEQVKLIFSHGNYAQVLGFVEWVLRHSEKPYELEKHVQWALEMSHAAYRLVDGNTIVPIGSEGERVALENAFADIAATEFNGARTHLRNAASALTAGQFADSVRESIHAVESVARVLEPKATTLPPALAKLEKSIGIHSALRSGFEKLYGYTSDEKGVRHALLAKGAPKVDETDALYMLGSCAAFVSYLINKARSVGT